MRENQIDFNVDELYTAFLALESKEECSAFFKDLFSPGEIRSVAQRLEVAKMLDAGETFTEIEEKTGASSATIARINRCLQNGSGYRTVLEKIR